MTLALSASGLWRNKPCPASAALPKQRVDRADARRGREEHAKLEASPPPGSIPEIAFAYNVRSGRAREVGRSIGREYGKLEEGEIPGTADLLSIQDDHVLVTDWKTGSGFNVTHPSNNLQLMHNSLCAALVFDKPRAIAQIVFTKTGEVLDAEYDLFALAAIKQELRDIWERCNQASQLLSMGAEPPSLVALGLVVEGSHCWRCESVKACPLKGRKAA